MTRYVIDALAPFHTRWRDPQRIQRKRTTGWKMPPNTVYVGRPSAWANPFKIGEHGTAAECVALFRDCIIGNAPPGRLTKGQLAAANKAWPDCFAMPDQVTARIFLKGKNLACWCAIDKPCHADILLKLANVPDAYESILSDNGATP